MVLSTVLDKTGTQARACSWPRLRVVTEIETGPNGHLYAVSTARGAIYEILPAGSIRLRVGAGDRAHAYAATPLDSAIAAISSEARSNSSSDRTGVPSKGRSRVISSHERHPW